MIIGLLIKFGRIFLAGAINRSVEARRRKLPTVNEQFPGPGDRFFFEIVTKAPVAEHFEKSVVIGIKPDVIKIVMFASSPNAFLSISDTRWPVWDLFLAQEIGHELVHAGVGKQKVRRVGKQAGGGYDRVLLLLEEV